MEAICGGVGEVAQICVLYPLETIKVGRIASCLQQPINGLHDCIVSRMVLA